MTNDALNYYDRLLAVDPARMERLYTGLQRRGIPEDKIPIVLSYILEESGGDPKRSDKYGRGLMDGMDYEDNMFIDDDDSLIESQLDSIYDAVSSGRIDMDIDVGNTMYGDMLQYGYGKMYAEGGDMSPDAEYRQGLEAYKQAQRDAIIAAALQNSRTRTLPAVPVVPDTYIELTDGDILRRELNIQSTMRQLREIEAAKSLAMQSDFSSNIPTDEAGNPVFGLVPEGSYNPDTSMFQGGRFSWFTANDIQSMSPEAKRAYFDNLNFHISDKKKDIEQLENEIATRRMRISGGQGASCIYTATDNYGKPYMVSGNMSFYSNPQKYGFTPIAIEDVQPGDIVQDDARLRGNPGHAMIFNGYDSSGRPTFNYSAGGSDPEDIKKNSHYYFGDDYPFAENARAYRFVGTEADQKGWADAYAADGQSFASGGNLFYPGGELDDSTGNQLREEESENGIYYRNLLNYAAENPEGFWADTPEASKARMWLHQNSPDDLVAQYYADRDIVKIDPRFVPEKAKSMDMKRGVAEAESNAAPIVGAALATPVALGEAIGAGLPIVSSLSKSIPHIINVMSNPALARTSIGAASSVLADSFGLVSGAKGLGDDISKALNGEYAGVDVPKTLLDASVLIPGSSVLTREVPNVINGAKVYTNGVLDRTAEAVLRLGDKAKHPYHVRKQMLNKDTLNYIFNPNAPKDLAYNLPYNYSGDNYSGETAQISGAHFGDIIDQYIGKTPIPGAKYNSVPSILEKYVKTRYPGRNIPTVDIGEARSDFILSDIPGTPKDVMENYAYDFPKVFGARSGGVRNMNGTYIVDPGGFNLRAEMLGDRGIRFDGYDIWKFNPEDYIKNNLAYESGLKGITNKLTNLLTKKGLQFIDSRGTPIIHHWTETYPEYFPYSPL